MIPPPDIKIPFIISTSSRDYRNSSGLCSGQFDGMIITRSVMVFAVLFGFVLACISYKIFLYYPDFESGRSEDVPMNMVRTQVSEMKLTNVVHCSQRQSSKESALKIGNDSNTRDIWFSTFLLILVPIRPSDKDSRQLIRDTWFEGYKNTKDVALKFVAGIKNIESENQTKLTKENETFGDIIFVDTVEDVAALTNKTLALINWAHHHVNFSYLMKCDDDTFVFVDNMIKELRKRPTTTKLYYGIMHSNIRPRRGNRKWGDNEWEISKTYLPFAVGGGYILSHDLVAILSKESSHLKWHSNEDAAIGAWVSGFNHERRSSQSICMWRRYRHLSSCKDPVSALLLYGHSNNERIDHFYYFHEHANSNDTVKRILELIRKSSSKTSSGTN